MKKLCVSVGSFMIFGVLSSPIQSGAQGVIKSSARVALPFPSSGTVNESAPLDSDRFVIESICGPTDDSQHVELYDGTLGPTEEFVSLNEPSTAQLQWIPDLASRFSKAGESPGTVAGARWCTGTLIAENLLITAAHCFRIDPNGWQTPRRGGIPVPPEEIATLMRVNFNYQINGQTSKIRNPTVYQIVELVEFGDIRKSVQGLKLDYAIVRMSPAENDQSPGARFPIAEFDASVEGLHGATLLTLIQHPQGSPKKIEAGAQIVEPRDVLLRYGDLDTLGGSSGAGILDDRGLLIGVHTNGGCIQVGGFNFGVSLNAIAAVSDVIQQ